MNLGQMLSEELHGSLLGLAALMARLGPALWVSPLLGGRLLPATAKTAVVVAICLALAAPLSPSLVGLADTKPWLLGVLLVKEALLGMALGFVVAQFFWAAEAAGRLVDTVRGSNMAEVLVPQMGARSSAVGNLLFQLTLVLFLLLGGHRLFIAALGASYQAIPVLHIPSATGLAGFAQLAMRLTSDLLLWAVMLAAPMLAAVFLADMTLGIINRFVPQVNAFFLAMPLKALAGLAVLGLALGLLAEYLPGGLDLALAHMRRAIALLSG